MSSRQQQRKLEQAMTNRGQALIKSGMPVSPAHEDVIAVTVLMSRTLADTTDASRASRAASLMHALTAASTRAAPGTAKLACAKGCGYCCHSFVTVTAPEVLLITEAIRSDKARAAALTASLLARCARTTGLSVEQRFGAKLPCPLLVDNVCSRYRERPSACRQTTSFDLAGCRDEFDGKGFGSQIQVSNVYLAHARNSRLPLLAALQAASLPGATYELSEALARALQTPKAETRWLAGEDVFAGVQRVAEAPAQAALVTALAADVSRLGGTQTA